jgi:hypothetical protein
MKNLAVKFAVIESRFHKDVSIRSYLGLTPEAGLRRVLGLLQPEARTSLLFAFTENALLSILEDELEVQMDSGHLLFVKPTLDAQSIVLAQDLDWVFTPEEQAYLEELVDWMFRHTRSLFRDVLGPQKALNIQDEYAELFRLFAHRYHQELGDEWLAIMLNETRLNNRPLFRQMMQCGVVDAIFKTNAIKGLLGENSSYADAWFRKSHLRGKISEVLMEAPAEVMLSRHFHAGQSA